MSKCCAISPYLRTTAERIAVSPDASTAFDGPTYSQKGSGALTDTKLSVNAGSATISQSHRTTVYQFDPTRDNRWSEFLLRHPDASVFHTRAWLDALRETYGYDPVVLTTAAPGEPLENGLAFCRINSWLTGSRMVSLPFSDHCQPLLDGLGKFSDLLSFVTTCSECSQWKYVELRPLTSPDWRPWSKTGFAEGESFYFHQLDLRPSLDETYRRFHKSCVQRKLRRASREKLTLEEGRSETLLKKFYRLLVMTRRRHQLLPQPFLWFRNLVRFFGESLLIRVASKDGRPIASVVTLSYKKSVVYKYGCSDPKFHNLGGMPLLYWRAIQDAKERGAEAFDFGRSELGNPGLITFKDRWGTGRSQITYLRYNRGTAAMISRTFGMETSRRASSSLPDFCLCAAGRLFYRHIG